MPPAPPNPHPHPDHRATAAFWHTMTSCRLLFGGLAAMHSAERPEKVSQGWRFHNYDPLPHFCKTRSLWTVEQGMCVTTRKIQRFFFFFNTAATYTNNNTISNYNNTSGKITSALTPAATRYNSSDNRPDTWPSAAATPVTTSQEFIQRPEWGYMDSVTTTPWQVFHRVLTRP